MSDSSPDLVHQLGYVSDTASPSGLQYRWTRGKAQIDILLPDGIDERQSSKRGFAGGLMTPTPGGTSAINRVQVVPVQVGDRLGRVPRPTLIGGMLIKSAAYTKVTNDPGDKDRHMLDFALMVSMVDREDFLGANFMGKEPKVLRKMLAEMESSTVWRHIPEAEEGRVRALRLLENRKK